MFSEGLLCTRAEDTINQTRSGSYRTYAAMGESTQHRHKHEPGPTPVTRALQNMKQDGVMESTGWGWIVRVVLAGLSEEEIMT